jgi:hypothetical protein
MAGASPAFIVCQGSGMICKRLEEKSPELTKGLDLFSSNASLQRFSSWR